VGEYTGKVINPPTSATGMVVEQPTAVLGINSKAVDHHGINPKVRF